MTAPINPRPTGIYRVAEVAGVAWRGMWRFGRESARQGWLRRRDRAQQRHRMPRPRRTRGGRPPRRRKYRDTRIPCPNRVRGCKYTQAGVSPRVMFEHLRFDCKKVPHRQPQRAAGNRPAARAARPGPARGRAGRAAAAARLTTRINDLISQMGPHMEEMKAAAAQLRRVGEAIDANSLHELLDGYVGLQVLAASLAELIIDVTDFADTEMWVDLQALKHGWAAADEVQDAIATLQMVGQMIGQLYAGQLAAEEEADEGGTGARRLNPDRLRAATR